MQKLPGFKAEEFPELASLAGVDEALEVLQAHVTRLRRDQRKLVLKVMDRVDFAWSENEITEAQLRQINEDFLKKTEKG